jgi:murein DD-endopeptidase MepM/ murein hydrolase activator NlpD
MIGVVYVWLPLQAHVRYPSNWHHEVTLAVAPAGAEGGAKDTTREIAFSGARFTLSPRPPVQIGPPLQGGPWWAMETMDNGAVHRRAMVLGMPFVSQRFAADYIMLGDNGRPYHGNEIGKVENWYGYGRNVLAVADGVIVDVNEGLPDNVPGSNKTVVELTTDNINGNYVVLDIGGGQYAAYAHLAPGSVRVSLGEAVRKGDVLGKLGNSGNSPMAPHLHFHIGSSNHIFAAEGLPFIYESFQSYGAVSLQQMQADGFKPGDAAPITRRNEIPAHDSVIVFPERHAP